MPVLPLPALSVRFNAAIRAQGHLEVVWLLLQSGFSVTEVDDVGNNALHLACAGGHKAIVNALISCGCEFGCELAGFADQRLR